MNYSIENYIVCKVKKLMRFGAFKGIAKTLAHFASFDNPWPVVYTLYAASAGTDRVAESDIIVSYEKGLGFSLYQVTPSGKYNPGQNRSTRQIIINEEGQAIHYDDDSKILEVGDELRRTGRARVGVIRGFHIRKESPADPQVYAQEQAEELINALISRSVCATPQILNRRAGDFGR